MHGTRIFPLILLAPLCAAAQQTGPDPSEVLAAMKRATTFMFTEVANRDGFLWLRTVEGEPYGELKARPSMIWVEPPGTPSAGLMLLEAYAATGDAYYLDMAKRAAVPLAQGQHASGGWDYFIDFDPAGLQPYYDAFFSKCWGWQEYLKKRDNCTFDDYSTTEPTRFFLRLYAATQDPAHRRTLDRALEHILRAQYPNGGWPQRFPLEDDYTKAYTFNDDVILDCILVFHEAAQTLNDPRYAEAARRGMDFYIAAQLPEPQPGWPQQCNEDFEPVWGRPFEIGTVSATQTHSNILHLFLFYGMTGDRKYLEPVPRALDWLERSAIPGAEGFTHTGFYEMGTNRPVYIRQTGTTIDDVAYTLTYEEEGCYPYSHRVTIPVHPLREEHARLAALPPEEARAEYEQAQSAHTLPEDIRGHYMALALAKTDDTGAGIRAILDARTDEGGWIDTISLLDPFSPFTTPPREVRAYTTGGYIARMYRMINYLNEDTSE